MQNLIELSESETRQDLTFARKVRSLNLKFMALHFYSKESHSANYSSLVFLSYDFENRIDFGEDTPAGVKKFKEQLKNFFDTINYVK